MKSRITADATSLRGRQDGGRAAQQTAALLSYFPLRCQPPVDASCPSAYLPSDFHFQSARTWTTFPRKAVSYGTYYRFKAFVIGASCGFILKSRMLQSEFAMNIFYIIGVVVVIIFVAGFFGLHA
jgi:hypothetical protein